MQTNIDLRECVAPARCGSSLAGYWPIARQPFDRRRARRRYSTIFGTPVGA